MSVSVFMSWLDGRMQQARIDDCAGRSAYLGDNSVSIGPVDVRASAGVVNDLSFSILHNKHPTPCVHNTQPSSASVYCTDMFLVGL